MYCQTAIIDAESDNSPIEMSEWTLLARCASVAWSAFPDHLGLGGRVTVLMALPEELVSRPSSSGSDFDSLLDSFWIVVPIDARIYSVKNSCLKTGPRQLCSYTARLFAM